MKQPAERDVKARLLEESQEIKLEFKDRAPPETVAKCMTEAQSGLADARVTDFLPIFFGRRARRLLRDATEHPTGSAPTA